MATQKPLKFIHIAKNAGTSIEAIGRDNLLSWGHFDSEYRELGNNRNGFNRHLLPERLSPEYLAKYDFFMVVRNPYTRTLSQMLFTRVNTSSKINATLHSGEFRIIPEGGIMTEQYKYMIPGVHILHFENLEAEFNALMVQYGLPARMNKHLNKSINQNNITLKDFDAASIEFIQKRYQKDFEMFGYSLDIPKE